MSSYENPTVQNFKDYFSRDFPYGSDVDTTVVDGDISRALSEAGAIINPCLFYNQDIYIIGFLYLAAHMLVTNLMASSQGVNGQYTWLQSSKNVGSVGESLAIPQRILDNPEYAALAKTFYGNKYLMMILPLLSGACFTVRGTTKP